MSHKIMCFIPSEPIDLAAFRFFKNSFLLGTQSFCCVLFSLPIIPWMIWLRRFKSGFFFFSFHLPLQILQFLCYHFTSSQGWKLEELPVKYLQFGKDTLPGPAVRVRISEESSSNTCDTHLPHFPDQLALLGHRPSSTCWWGQGVDRVEVGKVDIKPEFW